MKLQGGREGAWQGPQQKSINSSKAWLFSVSIAADRGGNERGVNVSKRRGYIKRGFLPGMDACTFNDLWLCLSFQTNFIIVQFCKQLKVYC